MCFFFWSSAYFYNLCYLDLELKLMIDKLSTFLYTFITLYRIDVKKLKMKAKIEIIKLYSWISIYYWMWCKCVQQYSYIWMTLKLIKWLFFNFVYFFLLQLHRMELTSKLYVYYPKVRHQIWQTSFATAMKPIQVIW